MLTHTYHVIGVMSGTSLDGIDLVYVKLTKANAWSYEILTAETLPYETAWKQRLQKGISLEQPELLELDKDYTAYLGDAINRFIKKNNISRIDAVCSHGHTILHQPNEGFTLQIGNLEQLATIVNQTVVCDFRVQDVEYGGQGAPLVPIGDRLLFRSYDYCLNLGGFANISKEQEGERIAYDICPVNTVLNFYAEQLGLPFDDGGNIARNASVHSELLQHLNALDFYTLEAPKSLGYEWVQDVVLPLIETYNISAEEKIATFTQHCAIQILNNLTAEVSKNSELNSVLITGGGAFNTYLIELISAKENNEIVVPDALTVNFKEALVFAFLGVLKLRNEINVLSSVTGAAKNHSSGKILQP